MCKECDKVMSVIPEKIIASLPDEVARRYESHLQLLYSGVRFTMPLSPVHAMPHCERVLLHVLTLASKEMPGDTEAAEILAQAAVFHDTRRFDDYIDAGHGARAAVYYEEYCRSHSEMNFHPEVSMIMRYHDMPDVKGIEAIGRRFGASADRVERLYAIFKDADALDRFRLSDDGLDPKFLRTESSKGMIDFARNLVEITMEKQLLSEMGEKVRTIKEAVGDSRRVLLIVDPQVDFITGSLAVSGAVEAMDALAKYISDNPWKYVAIVLTGDRHPYGHISFSDWGGEWPRHCVADSTGAAFWPPLLEAAHESMAHVYVIHKGERPDKDEYSALESMSHREMFGRILHRVNATETDVCGLAGNICVRSTLADGIKAFPEMKFRVLIQFSPSLDGGKALDKFIKDNL